MSDLPPRGQHVYEITRPDASRVCLRADHLMVMPDAIELVLDRVGDESARPTVFFGVRSPGLTVTRIDNEETS